MQQAATTFATGSLAGQGITARIEPSVDLRDRSLTIRLSVDVPTYLVTHLGPSATRVEVSGTARVVGGAPISVIGLDPKTNFTIEMDKSARLETPACAIYSNSRKPNGLIAKNSAVM